MRGEYSNAESKGTTSAELPPRARRILGRTESKIRLIGTTSACAENTYPHHHQCPWGWNYLRVRGEYDMIAHHQICIVELPPRARRIRWGLVCYVQAGGTTSACAENTKPVKTSNPNPRNYLRVRGEYAPARPLGIFSSELPPRARRIPAREVMAAATEGTTSACAENTA